MPLHCYQHLIVAFPYRKPPIDGKLSLFQSSISIFQTNRGRKPRTDCQHLNNDIVNRIYREELTKLSQVRCGSHSRSTSPRCLFSRAFIPNLRRRQDAEQNKLLIDRFKQEISPSGYPLSSCGSAASSLDLSSASPSSTSAAAAAAAAAVAAAIASNGGRLLLPPLPRQPVVDMPSLMAAAVFPTHVGHEEPQDLSMKVPVSGCNDNGQSSNGGWRLRIL